MEKSYRIVCFTTALFVVAVMSAQEVDSIAPSRMINPILTDDNSPSVQQDESQMSDTIKVMTPGEMAVYAMTEDYKSLKEAQYEGEDEETFYPRTMNLYLNATKALKLAENDEQTSQVKNVLLDINSLLVKGAFYYSNNGNQTQLANFARAYIDTQRLSIFKDFDFNRNPNVYPTLVYIVAADSYNTGDFDSAKIYFEMYLATGEEKMRHQVCTFMGQACVNTKDYLKGVNTMSNASIIYPDDFQLVAMGIQCCIEGGYADRIQPLLDRALLMKPGDEQLLNVQAQVYESNQDYRKALDIYNQIAELHPNSLENTQRIATCYYNLGISFYNKSIMEEDEKIAKKSRRQSLAYFQSASQYLEQIVRTKPNDKTYLRALGVSYGCLDDKEKFDEINIRLGALGEKPMVMRQIPETIGSPLTKGGSEQGTASSIAAPSYQEFAKKFIEDKLGTWTQRGEFEKIEDYQLRMTEGKLQTEYESLKKQAEKEYLGKYAFKFVPRDLQLEPYDVTNETYLIKTPYGNATIKVPLKNKEAEIFKNDWTNNKIEIRAPRYMIDNDHVAIASIAFKTASGKSYVYDSNKAGNYEVPNVKVDLNKYLSLNPKTKKSYSDRDNTKTKLIAKTSDVDKDIPQSSRTNSNTFAFIIANENYKNVSNVASALHDGYTFYEYCEKTLGIPKSQIVFLCDASLADSWSQFDNLKARVENRQEDIDVILFYSGHGLPDDNTKEAYLLPVDASPQHSRTMIKLQELYDGFGRIPNVSLYAFMDACFSGSTRQSGQKEIPIVAAKGVALRHKKVEPAGNVFVLSAASAQQTAFPYEEKDHGMFTYWLLKKLQDSKGNATLEDITKFVTEKVSTSSLEINTRVQTPTQQATGKLANTWKRKRLKL